MCTALIVIASELSHGDGRSSFCLGKKSKPLKRCDLFWSVFIMSNTAVQVEASQFELNHHSKLHTFCKVWLLIESRSSIFLVAESTCCFIVADLLQTDGWAHQTECASVATVMLAHYPPIIMRTVTLQMATVDHKVGYKVLSNISQHCYYTTCDQVTNRGDCDL